MIFTYLISLDQKSCEQREEWAVGGIFDLKNLQPGGFACDYDHRTGGSLVFHINM